MAENEGNNTLGTFSKLSINEPLPAPGTQLLQ